MPMMIIIDVQNDYFPGGSCELYRPLEAEKKIKELIICGMMTHMCVDTTVRAAMDYGYSVIVVGDACATMDLAINGETVPADMVQKAFLAALDGVFATII